MKINNYLIIAFLFSISIINVTAQTLENFDVSKRLDSLYTELYKYGEFNGNILVAKDGKDIYLKSYGILDADKNVPLKSNSIFYLASVSKQFTAFSIFLLEKDGKLSFEDTISKYLPELKFYKHIKIKHLIYHTSGLPNYTSLFQDEKYDSKSIINTDVINQLEQAKPDVNFEPGEKF